MFILSNEQEIIMASRLTESIKEMPKEIAIEEAKQALIDMEIDEINYNSILKHFNL